MKVINCFFSPIRFHRKHKFVTSHFCWGCQRKQRVKKGRIFPNQTKCFSYDKKDLNKHFKKMIQLFFALGANINLKQDFLSSLPKSLADGAKMYIHNKFYSILNLSAGQIRQVFLSLDDLCNMRKII